MAVSADGRRAVSGGDDGTVRVWDLDTGDTAAHPDRPRRLGERGGGQRGRPPRRLRRQRRRDGAGVGPRRRRATAHTLTGHRREGGRGGGQRRRPPRGLRRPTTGRCGYGTWPLASRSRLRSQRLRHWLAADSVRRNAEFAMGPRVVNLLPSAPTAAAPSPATRRDGAGVGPRHRRAAAHPDRPRRLGQQRWRSARTAAARSPAATTGRCGSGTWTPGDRCTP